MISHNGLITIILQFVGRHTINRIIRKSVTRATGETKLDEKKRENTIIAIIRTTYSAIVWLLAMGAFLTIVGVNVEALLTGAGIIGVFVALSARNTVTDLLGGVFILTERQYRVGMSLT